jgi:hypothetical protein
MRPSPRWHNLLGLILTSTRYGAAGAFVGGLAVFFSPYLGLSPALAFFAGCCLPIGPLYFWFSSDRAVRGRLTSLKKWKDDGLISAKEYDSLRKQALRWYGQRLFGREEETPSGATPPSAGGGP